MNAGESNLAFVREEEEEEEEEGLETENKVDNTKFNSTRDYENNNSAAAAVETKFGSQDMMMTTGKLESKLASSSHHCNTSRMGPNVRLGGIKETHMNDRRRSSGEIIRQSRAYKRISRAFSQISFHNNVNSEITYELEGITEDVSFYAPFFIVVILLIIIIIRHGAFVKMITAKC